MENVKWIFIEEIQVNSFWYEDYISEDKTLCKRVWYDGYVEIYSCA